MKEITLCALAVAIVIPAYIYVCGAVSRMMGSDDIDVPRIVDKALFSLLMALPVLALSLDHWAIALGVFGGTIGFCNMGHLDFWYGVKENRDQTATPLAIFIYELFFGTVDRQDWRYDAIGMAIVGAAATVPVGIGFIVAGHPIIGALLAVSGSLKAYAYRDGLSDDPAVRAGFTEKGEWRRGWYDGFAVAVATIICRF